MSFFFASETAESSLAVLDLFLLIKKSFLYSWNNFVMKSNSEKLCTFTISHVSFVFNRKDELFFNVMNNINTFNKKYNTRNYSNFTFENLHTLHLSWCIFLFLIWRPLGQHWHSFLIWVFYSFLLLFAVLLHPLFLFSTEDLKQFLKFTKSLLIHNKSVS